MIKWNFVLNIKLSLYSGAVLFLYDVRISPGTDLEINQRGDWLRFRLGLLYIVSINYSSSKF